VRDAATAVPDDYAPPDFRGSQFQHTNPRLTWDADDDTRKKALSKRLSEDAVKDADFAAYLGSDDEDEEEGGGGGGDSDGDGDGRDAEAIRARYLALLLGADKEAGGKGRGGKGGGGKGGAQGGASSSGSDGEAAPAPKAESRARGGGMDMEVTFASGALSPAACARALVARGGEGLAAAAAPPPNRTRDAALSP